MYCLLKTVRFSLSIEILGLPMRCQTHHFPSPYFGKPSHWVTAVYTIEVWVSTWFCTSNRFSAHPHCGDKIPNPSRENCGVPEWRDEALAIWAGGARRCARPSPSQDHPERPASLFTSFTCRAFASRS
jgi:hypothetical protein